MTGRELIMYILQNKLEDTVIFESPNAVWQPRSWAIYADGIEDMFISIEQVAAKFEVGVETAKIWNAMGMIKGYQIGEALIFHKDIKDPRGE